VVESASKIVEIIRMQQCLRERYFRGSFHPSSGWRAMPTEWVDVMRKSFESQFDVAKRTGGGMVTGNGYVGYIEPGSYESSEVNRKWESFIRGAISHRLLLLSGQISG
jgi:hypothetical protein